MPKISRIEAAPYNIRLKSRLTWGRGHELRQLSHVLVRVELSDGAFGIAEAPARPSIYGETQATILHIIESHLTPMLLDAEVESFSSVVRLAPRMARIKNNNTAKGALDMALHRALSLSRGQTLRAYLGATREKILLSAIVSTGPPDAVFADVRALYETGLRVFKVKIGRDFAGELDMIERLIEAFPAARFYVDANETLSSDKAADLLNRLHEMGVLYCEEALPIHLLRERRRLRRDCSMPIIADDSAFTLDDLEREIAFDTFDILNVKTARTGFSESRWMLERCAQNGKEAMVGSQASSLLGCTHAAIFAGRAEVTCASECSFYLKTEAGDSAAPPIVDGWLSLADAERALGQLQAELANFA